MYCFVNVYVKARLKLVLWLARRNIVAQLDNFCTDLWFFEQVDEKLHCKCKSVCKIETPTCHVARQEGHGWALELNGTPNRRPRFYAVKLYSGLFKCILHRIAPFKCFIHPPLVALFTLAMISKLFRVCWIAVMVKHLIHTRQITQFKSLWTKNETI